MLHVLVLDSESTANAHRALDPAGIALLSVTSVDAARQILGEFDLDVWVCDLAVPDLDFKELLPIAKARNPDLRIIFTGPPTVHFYARQQISLGNAESFLPKPWQPANMRRIVCGVQSLGEARKAKAEAESAAKKRVVFLGGPSSVPSQKTAQPAGGQHRMIAQKPQQAQPAARYRLDAQIGEGGSGRIYRAYDLLLEMEVAIKTLASNLVRDVESVQLLKQEARIGLMLTHPNIVRLYDLDFRNDIYLLVMEYIRGGSLKDLLAGGARVEPADAVTAVSSLASALDFAHSCGVIHKDISPANILFTDEGILKIIDFGIADLASNAAKDQEFIVGTPAYVSPEQLRGEPLDTRTDIHAIGVVAHQLLTGRILHPEDTALEALSTQPHPPIQGLPPTVTAVLEKATAFDRDQRYSTAGDFARDFAAAVTAELCRQ